ncbi:hypothetical protein amb4255 [Paramagnetospirillum magneticum AMB-1]|uniref:Uncharacterized protein n=2 Tax=Paramagnetospirillum magneticum TaxID=84159 RepID=Q2VZB6_PARM1|nr:hypothetical protein amb4255 [Paramagnetospirillum magneticum AMB-1]
MDTTMLPFPLTEASLKAAMRDPRYTESSHPASKAWRDSVAQGFATLYPDETLRGDHTDQLERHQGADGHIYASDGTKVASGTVRVRSYTRTVNGHVVEVAAHDRSGGSEGKAADQGQSAPPANKKAFFDSKNPPGTWDDFRGKAQSLPNTGEAGKFALVEIFGQEGGVPKDSTSSASAGILQETLDNAKDAGVPGLEKTTTPAKLSNEQRAAVMRYKLDQEELGHAGGIKALESFGDAQSAAAMADTLYRHGGVDGPKLLQGAINDVKPGAVPKTGYMGKQTLEAYGRLASSPETKGRLLDALAKRRTTVAPYEKARFDYYRYSGRR